MGSIIVVTVILLIAHFAVYFGAFWVTMSDDIEMNCGKKALKKYSRSTQNVAQKYFFVGMIKHIRPLHYILFIINNVCFPLICVGVYEYILNDPPKAKEMTIILIGVYVLAAAISCNVRNRLYKGNIVRRRSFK